MREKENKFTFNEIWGLREDEEKEREWDLKRERSKCFTERGRERMYIFTYSSAWVRCDTRSVLRGV